jgi:hypothetical protein
VKAPILIPDIRRAWRFASVRVATLAALFGTLTPDQQAAILAWLHVPPDRLPLALGLLFILARVLQTSEDKAQ